MQNISVRCLYKGCVIVWFNDTTADMIQPNKHYLINTGSYQMLRQQSELCAIIKCKSLPLTASHYRWYGEPVNILDDGLCYIATNDPLSTLANFWRHNILNIRYEYPQLRWIDTFEILQKVTWDEFKTFVWLCNSSLSSDYLPSVAAVICIECVLLLVARAPSVFWPIYMCIPICISYPAASPWFVNRTTNVK